MKDIPPKKSDPRLVAVRRRKLMENPHYEGGSQDEVVISASESKVEMMMFMPSNNKKM